MSNKNIQLFCKDLLESHFGFTVNSYRDISLLESCENSNIIESISFRRYGFNHITYIATKNYYGYDLQVAYEDSNYDEQILLPALRR